MVPRKGKSQREILVLGPVAASIPAAWFSLSPSRDAVLDAVVILLTAMTAVAWVRLLFVGAKHWVWVDPRCGKLVRLPSQELPPKRWWFERLSSGDAIRAILDKRAYERDEVPSDWCARACVELYAQVSDGVPDRVHAASGRQPTSVGGSRR